MSNIRVDVRYTIKDGSELKFRSPVDCSAITGLIVYYPGEDGNTTSKVFALADAHGNNVGNIDHLFAENVVVKVILDVTTSMAFVQNADTNAYLEEQLASKRPNTWLPTLAEIGAAPSGYGLGGVCKQLTSADDLNLVWQNGYYCWWTDIPTNAPTYAGTETPMAGCAMRVWNATPYEGTANTIKMMQEVRNMASGDSNKRFTLMREVYINRNTGELYSATPWEYEVPPMEPGVGYRTTERCEGKPVYTKLIDFGAFNGSSAKDFSIGTTETISIPFRWQGFATKPDGLNWQIPSDKFTANMYLYKIGATTYIYMSVNPATSLGDIALNGKLQIWYTKD